VLDHGSPPNSRRAAKIAEPDSGINEGADSFHDLNAKSLDQMMRYLRQYCEVHPLGDFRDAARDLAKSLPSIRKD